VDACGKRTIAVVDPEFGHTIEIAGLKSGIELLVGGLDAFDVAAHS
jgi:hypothetical protein